MNGRAPEYIKDLFKPKEQITSLALRDDGNKLAIPFPKTDSLKHSLATVEQSSGTVCQDLNEMRLFFQISNPQTCWCSPYFTVEILYFNIICNESNIWL